MASWGQTGSAGRVAVGVGGAVAVAAAGLLAWWFTREAPQPPVADPAAVAVAVAPEVTAPPKPEPLSVLPPPVPPSFDVVRVEADGAAQVAGRGAPDSRILLQVDGAQVSEADVAGDGAFVALFTLAPNPNPSLLSLLMIMPDGTEVPGTETVALAPISGPVVVAEPAVPQAPVAEPPAALLVTDQGVEVLQAPAAEVVAGVAAAVSIDTISYTKAGAVQFGGRGETGQVVRLYLDNAALAEAAVVAGGQWGVTQDGIAPGIYTLRADQVDGTGKVTSRFETPFKRETLTALAEAASPPAVVPDAQPETQPQVLATDMTAPEATPDTGTVPDVSATVGPAAVAEPAPLSDPPLATTQPLVPEPAVEPEVDTTTPVQSAGAAQPVATEDPVATAAPDAAPAVVAATQTTPAPAADPAPAGVASPVSITVQPGLTLWAIAEANFGDGVRYVQVYEANKDKIRDPDLIYPGQVFTVPAEP